MRGALALLSLWLVQEVVGTVLLLGCVGLALYAANQVFGMRLPDVSSFGDGPPSSGRAQAPGAVLKAPRRAAPHMWGAP